MQPGPEGNRAEAKKMFSEDRLFGEFPQLVNALIDIQGPLLPAIEACSTHALEQNDQTSATSLIQLTEGLQEASRYPELVIVNAPVSNSHGSDSNPQVYLHMLTSSENFPIALSTPLSGRREVYMYKAEPEGVIRYPGIWLRESFPSKKAPRRLVERGSMDKGIQIGCLDFVGQDPIAHLDPTPAFSFNSNELRNVYGGIRSAYKRLQFRPLPHS